MKTKVHALAGSLSFLIIAAFWTASVVAEFFLAPAGVAAVKQGIAYALIVLVACMAATGASGFAMAGRHPIPSGKRRRMPFIALNGLLILIPAALYLNAKAQTGEFDTAFYSVQGLELIAGAGNLFLIGLNIRDGRRLRRDAR